MSNRVLISFIGSHDLKRETTKGKGPLEKIINKIRPAKIYLFVTNEYQEEWEKKNLSEYYKDVVQKETDIILKYVPIDDPSNPKEVVEKIINDIEEINNELIEKKYQGFVNLTSGTPAIISVLSLFATIGTLNRTEGTYAPNYTEDIKTNSLNFYKNSFAYKIIKTMINSYDYTGLSEFVKNHRILPKLSNKEFETLVNFAKAKQICDFKEIEKCYNELEDKSIVQYDGYDNLYDKAKICYFGLKSAIRQNDNFQAILKSAIIRENLTTFLLENSLKKYHMEDLIFTENKDTKQEPKKYINTEDVVKDKYKEIFELLEKGKIDIKYPIGAFLEGKLIEVIIQYKKDDKLAKILETLEKLDEVRGIRNKLAHEVKTPPSFNKKWLEHIEEAIIKISEYYEFKLLKTDEIEEINKKMTQLLSILIN